MNHNFHVHRVRTPELKKEFADFRTKIDDVSDFDLNRKARRINFEDELKAENQDGKPISVLKKMHPTTPLDHRRNKSSNMVKRPSQLTQEEKNLIRAIDLRDKIIEVLYQQKLAEKSNEYRKFVFDRTTLRYDDVKPRVYDKNPKMTQTMRDNSKNPKDDTISPQNNVFLDKLI